MIKHGEYLEFCENLSKSSSREYLTFEDLKEFINSPFVMSIIADNWLKFIHYFPQLYYVEEEIRYTNVSVKEKAVLILLRLVQSTEPVPVKLFIKALQGIADAEY